jgi:hypothetical protein
MGKYYPACRLRGTTHLNARFITSTVIISSCGNHAAGGARVSDQPPPSRRFLRPPRWAMAVSWRAAFGGEAALRSRASEAERSAVPVEQKIAVDNP